MADSPEELLSEIADTLAQSTYPTLTYAVSNGDILRFCQATGENSPEYTSVEFAHAQGWTGLMAPPNFYLVPRAVWTLMAGADTFDDGRPQTEVLPEGISHSMAGETTVRFRADIFGGDVLTLSRRVDGTEVKRGRSGHFLLMHFETTATNAAGEIAFIERYSRVLR